MNAPDPRVPSADTAAAAPYPTATAAARPAARPARGRRAGWWTVTALAFLTALFTARYLTLDPEVFLDQQRAVYLAHRGSLVLHVGGGVLAILLGPWQFLPRLRARRPGLHRLTGRLYLLAVLAAGTGGLLMAPRGLVGPVAPIGFTGLAVLLLLSSALAWRAARRRDILRHRAWAVRSFALIMAAATLRIWLPVMDLAGVPFDQAYATAAWTCWLINLVVAEHVIARLPGLPPAARTGRVPAAPPAG
ncbi:DUF2306 domain-containing protein [Kitasatospora purpeofusca]|uniref:DUF2306 domain-containing protein n=1 Tax=Kitasatospora purpeofusca TaxID=67352 RepID=UPI00386D0859|nr:DUF2306 domain-containing protein [Kitasatospora purpeofusca]